MYWTYTGRVTCWWGCGSATSRPAPSVVVASTWWGEGAELVLDDNPTVEVRRAVRRAYRAW